MPPRSRRAAMSLNDVPPDFIRLVPAFAGAARERSRAVGAVCVTLGMLSNSQSKRLASAGLAAAEPRDAELQAGSADAGDPPAAGEGPQARAFSDIADKVAVWLDADVGDLYVSDLDTQVAGESASIDLTEVGKKYPSGGYITATRTETGAAATAGKIRVFASYVVLNRVNEVQT